MHAQEAAFQEAAAQVLLEGAYDVLRQRGCVLLRGESKEGGEVAGFTCDTSSGAGLCVSLPSSGQASGGCAAFAGSAGSDASAWAGLAIAALVGLGAGRRRLAARSARSGRRA